MVTKKNESNPENDKCCFVIMPFGGWLDTYYEEIYIPAIEAAGMKATRVDDLYRPGSIVNDIWSYTKSADIILADLTSKNPNVFYELGLAHAITKPAVLITASIEDIPFDLRSLRVLVYDKNLHNWGEELRNKITKALIETLKSPGDAILPTFLETTKSKRIEVSPKEKEILELRSELDSLKREVKSRNVTPIEKVGTEFTEEEAIARINYYLNSGMSEIKITRRIERDFGAPISWTRNAIKRLRKR